MDEAMEEFIFLFAWEPILLPAFAGWHCKTFNNNYLLLPPYLSVLWRYIADALTELVRNWAWPGGAVVVIGYLA
jgi:hypothetical protein